MRIDDWKWKLGKLRLKIRNPSLTVWVINHWNNFSSGMVDFPSPEVSKSGQNVSLKDKL